MFKKTIKIGAQNQLSGKDRKTIKNKLSQILNPDCVQVLFNKNDKIVSCKTSGGSKMIIYQGSQYPILVDGTGKSDYFPSVYTLQAYETLIKCLQINQGVEAYIFNGANLMWPGVRSYSQLKQFSKDQVIGIRNSKGQVIGIGAMGCSKKQFESNADKSGVAVYMLHYKGDKLWELGPKSPVQVVVRGQKKQKQEQKFEQIVEQKAQKKIEKQQKKEKKQKAQKKRESSEQKKSESAKDNSQQSSDEDLDFSNFAQVKKQQPKPVVPQVKVQKKQKNDIFSDQQDTKKGKKKGGKKGKGKAKKQEYSDGDDVGQKKQQQAPKSAISAKLMDQYFKQCFLNVLKLCNIQKQLPIDSGRFYMDYMLLARPEGVKLEIKDSTYKKLGKFYEDMSKQKFIEFKHAKDKKGQQGATINKIFYENQQLTNYQPTVYKLGDKEAQIKQEQQQSTQNTALLKKKKLNISKTFSVTTAYKPSKQLLSFLYPKTVNFIPTEEQEQQMKKQQQAIDNLPTYFSQNEIKAIIQTRINTINQIKSQNKDKAQKSKIVGINYQEQTQLAALLKKQIEDFEENAAGQSESDDEQKEQAKGKKKKDKKKGQKLLKMDRQVLVGKLMKKCSTCYHMIDKEHNIDVIKQGTFKGIQLVAEKANNKNITKIIGLQTFIAPKQQAQEQLNWLANVLQQKFACSCNLQNLPGKNAGKEVIVHGNFINDLQEMFVNQYGISKQNIALQNKLDKKKKNR